MSMSVERRRISRERRDGRHRRRHRRARTSGAATGAGPLAHGFELPEEPRHALRFGEKIASRVSALTEGRFEMRIFAAGEIVPPLQVLDAVQNGTVECGQTAGYYYVGKNPALAFDTALPFGMNARQQNAWVYYGGGAELMREVFRQYNIVAFPCGNTGTQMAGWYRKEIKSVADLKGLKMRVAGSPVRSSRASASCLSRSAGRTSIRAREGHDRCDGMGRSLRRREARLPQDRALLLLPGMVGGPAQLSIYVNAKHAPRCRLVSGGARSRVRRSERSYARALRREEHGGAAPAGLRRRAASAVSASGHGSGYKAAHELYGELGGEERRIPADLRIVGAISRRAAPVVSRRGEHVRQLRFIRCGRQRPRRTRSPKSYG